MEKHYYFKKSLFVLFFILFQTYLQAQTKVANDLGDSDDFTTTSDVYLERYAWESNYNIPDGTAEGAGELIHQETANDFWVFTDAPGGEVPIKSRTIVMSANAEFYTTAIGQGSTVYLGIRYKDLVPAYYGGEPVFSYDGSGWVQVGTLGGAFDHQWKVQVIPVLASQVAVSNGKYRFKIGIGTYGAGIESFLSVDRIELATTQGELITEPDTPGYYPAAGDGNFPGMDKDSPWMVDGNPYFPIGLAAGWTGMSEAAFDEIATAGFNTLVFYNWMDVNDPYAAGDVWDVLPSPTHYGFTEFLDACQARGLKAIGVFQNDVKWKVVKNYFGSEQACLSFIQSKCALNANHPALLGWSPVDEPDHSYIPEFYAPLEWCMSLKNAIRQGDPNHPVYGLEMGWRNGAFGHFRDIADYQGYDVYPNVGDPISGIGERADKLVNETGGEKPFIAYLKAYNRNSGDAYMSMGEAYLALIHGANGIFYWDYGSSNPIWDTLSQIANEVTSLDHVLLPPATTLDVNGSGGLCVDNSSQVENRYKQGSDGLNYILSANVENNPANNVQFTVNGLSAGTEIHVLFEDRSIISGAGTFTDNFSAYGRHVYQIGGSSPDNFTPIQIYEGSTDEMMGLNFIPNFTKNGQPTFPEAELFDHLYTVRMEATSESVTNESAMRINYDAGTKFTTTFPECDEYTFPSGNAGLTFYAKGSQNITLRLKTVNGESGNLNVTTSWQKFDIPYSPLFANLPSWHAVDIFAVNTQASAGYVLIDRFGMEQTFDPSPTIDIQPNTDTSISSSDILSGTENLNDLRSRLQSHQNLKVFGWGNSIADGTQMNRGGEVHPYSGWDYYGKIEERFYGRLATKLEEEYGYVGITPVDKATGGNWIISPDAITHKNEIISESSPGDLVIIEFGANDLNGGDVPTFASRVSSAVDEFKAVGLNVIIMTPPICVYDYPGANAAIEPSLTAAMEQIVTNKNVALVNILKLATYRGDKYAWAWENNGCHPGYWGHELMAQCFLALIENYSFTWTPTDDYPERVWTQASSDPKLFENVVTGVGSTWQTVNLPNSYNSMVVVCAVNYTSGDSPAVARVCNASGSSFDLKVQNPGGAALGGYTVHYMVVEEGVYTVATDGVKMEAVKYNSTITDEDNSWTGQSRSYTNSYTSPVVLGQVMTANDADWSVFWARGSAYGDPPSSSTLYTGKHVAEDTDVTRSNETIGYIVIEAGSGTMGSVPYIAALGGNSIGGFGSSPPYSYSINGLSITTTAVVSTAGVNGPNGGWPILYGSNPISASSIELAIDEDQIGDTERAHINEQVAHIVFGIQAKMASGDVSAIVPEGFSLSQNYPNPFSSETQISYQLPSEGKVTLKILDMLGREVAILVDETQPAGHHQATFNANSLSGGVYFYKLTVGKFTQIKKMTLTK